MPIDMLPNTAMRMEVKNLLQGISQDLQAVYDISKQLPEIKYANAGQQKEAPVEDPSSSSAVLSSLEKVMKPMSVAIASDLGLGISSGFSSTAAGFMKAAGYSVPATGLKGIAGFIGIILALDSVIGVKKAAAGLSGMDHLAQGLSAGGDFAYNVGIGSQTAFDIIGKFVDLGGGNGGDSWHGALKVKSAGESFGSVSGIAQFSAGCVITLAGAAMVTSGGIQLNNYGTFGAPWKRSGYYRHRNRSRLRNVPCETQEESHHKGNSG